MVMVTLDVRVVWIDGEKLFSRKAARQKLGIKTRKTFNDHLKALGLEKKRLLSVQDLTEILKLQVYLSACPGVNSRESYLVKRKFPKVLEAELRLAGIDLNHAIGELENAVR